MNILLAEDRKRVRNALRILLEQQPDWKVVAEACSASEMLDKAAILTPDLLLLDGDLIGIDDSQVIDELRRLCPQACIVAMVEPQGDSKWDENTPVDGYATKVNSPEFLLRVIVRCIEKKNLN